MERSEQGRRPSAPARVARIYLAFGLIWILATGLFVRDSGLPASVAFWIEVSKGTLFVLLSATLLYWLVRRESRATTRTVELFRAVIEGSTDAIFVKDCSGKYILMNEAAGRVAAKKVANLLGKDATDIFDSPSAADIQEHDRRVLESGAPETREEHLTIAGVPQVRLTTKAPLHDELGNVIGLIGVSRDITEQKRIEEDLREERDRFAGIVVSTPGVFYSFRLRPDGTSCLPFASPRIKDMFGVAPEALAQDSAPAFALMHPEDVENVRQSVRDSAQTMKLWHGEFRVRSLEGEIWLEGHAMPSPEPDGGVLWYGVLTDVTERHKQMERLKQLSRAVEQSPASVIITDLEGKIAYVNPKFTQLTGYTLEEVLGQNPRILKSGRLPTSVYEKMWGNLSAGREWMGELLNRKKNGELYWESVSISPIRDRNGRVTHYVGVKEDITARKQAEQALRESEERFRQAQKMEAIGHLAGGVAHDFNNMLTVITGYSEMMLMSLPPDDRQRPFVEAIGDAGRRAASLTRQLLAFSRQSVLEPKVLDLNEVVRETEKMLRRLIGEDVLLTTELSPELGRVKVDPGQLGQVLMNLAVNARDAMPRGGKLTLMTAMTPASTESAAEVALIVSDTGCGMTPEVKARIFEPFFTTKEVGKGTGLGLAVVHGVVSQSGGRIELESEPGRGTTFKIYFPEVRETATTDRDREPQGDLRGSETILVVEDEDAVRDLAQLALTSKGYRVLAARDGEDALRLLEQEEQPVDVLVADVVMPRMSGSELAGRLKTRHARMRVLFVSGYTDDAVVRHGISQEEVAFLQKPFSATSLVKKVRQVLDKREE